MTYQKHTITNINSFQTLCLSPYRTLPLKLRPLALVRNRKYSYIKNILTFFIEFWGRRLTFLKSIRKFIFLHISTQFILFYLTVQYIYFTSLNLN